MFEALTPWLLAAGAAIGPVSILIGAAIKARRSAQLGAEEETTKTIASLRGGIERRDEENAQLRTDLAASESDRRRTARELRDLRARCNDPD